MTGNATAPGNRQASVRWDDTRMATTYANRAEVSATREAISLLFGVEQARQLGQEAVQVQLSRRVALSPAVAKRLAIALRNAVQAQETGRVGQALESGGVDSARNNASGDSREPSGAELRLGKILSFFRQIRTLDAEIDFEHSFKTVHGELFADRFLLCVNRREVHDSPDERIATICERIGMPSNLLPAFRQRLVDANHVYFGVERDRQSLIFKTYLECRDRIEKEIDGAPVAGRSFPLFTGFKWDTFSPARQVVTRYDWYPSLPAPEMLERLRATLEASGRDGLFDIARGIAAQALEKISDGDIQYLEVSEEGNPRKSFDLNLYKAGLRLEDLFPHLMAAWRHHGIASEQYETLYRRIKGERFGHLAGGVDREGEDFMTVYYGVKRFHSNQLGSAAVAP